MQETSGRMDTALTRIATDQDLAQRFAALAPSFSRRRAANLTLLVGFGSVELLTRVIDGQVTDVTDRVLRPPLQSFDFSVRATSNIWHRFWQHMPAAGSHDIFALTRTGDMVLEGNLQPLMANLQFIKDLLAVGRETSA